MDRTLSMTVSEPVRARLQSMAERRGQSLPDLLKGAVDRLLAEDGTAPAPDEIAAALRAAEPDLRRRGIRGLWIFGSVARGEATPDSDVDLIAEIDPTANLSLTGYARLRLDLGELLGRPVDLFQWHTLRPHARETADRDAVRVW